MRRGAGCIDVDPQHLAQQAEGILRVAGGLDVAGALVVGVAAIPHGDVQVAAIACAIAEADPAAVVIRLRLIDRQDVGGAGRIGDVRVRTKPGSA